VTRPVIHIPELAVSISPLANFLLTSMMSFKFVERNWQGQQNALTLQQNSVFATLILARLKSRAFKISDNDASRSSTSLKPYLPYPHMNYCNIATIASHGRGGRALGGGAVGVVSNGETTTRFISVGDGAACQRRQEHFFTSSSSS